MKPKNKTVVSPSPYLAGIKSYRPPRSETPIDLFLDGNEGSPPSKKVIDAVEKAGPEMVRSYPNKDPLERRIAEALGVDRERVLVTAGADDALERIIRSVCADGRELVLPVPTFGMIKRYAGLTGCTVREVPWLTPVFPLADVLKQIRDNTTLLAIVTPSSPFGFTVTAADLVAVSEAAPHALLLADLAYTEFAEEDLTQLALSLPNAVITRSMSKARGLAGLRVGYAAGPKEVMEWLRIVGHPYAVSAPSIEMATASLDEGDGVLSEFVRAVSFQRDALMDTLVDLGAKPKPSSGNFVFSDFENASWVRDGLASLGIGIRLFPDKPYLNQGARITVPGNPTDFSRLETALIAALSPEAILFDVDDTLVDVSDSYKQTVIETAKKFGAMVTIDEIARAKAAGNANNEWELTYRLIRMRGLSATLEKVTTAFEAIYQGAGQVEGLKSKETLLIDPKVLERLATKVKLGIVTGRPKCDAETFLDGFNLKKQFNTVITMEDAPLKPNPQPVRLALERLGVSRAWMIGDTPDDIRAARAAGVISIGVVAPADEPETAKRALFRAGAGRILDNVKDVEGLLK